MKIIKIQYLLSVLSRSTWRNCVNHFSYGVYHNRYCEEKDKQPECRSASTDDKGVKNKSPNDNNRANISPELLKLKQRRRSVSPTERLGKLLKDSAIEWDIIDQKKSNTCVSHKNEISYANNSQVSKSVPSVGNLEKHKKNVIPSKRLQSMIPEDYWENESEDTKEIVDSLGNKTDTTDKQD